MFVECANTERSLSDIEIRELLCKGLGQLDLTGRRVLVVIPDGTRTAPIGLLFGLLADVLGSNGRSPRLPHSSRHAPADG